MLTRVISFSLIVFVFSIYEYVPIILGEVLTLNRHEEPCPPIRIFLYSNISEGSYQIDTGDTDNLRSAPFVKGLPIKLIIPGYTTRIKDVVFGLVVTAYRNNGHYNLLYVYYLDQSAETKCAYRMSVKNLSTCIYKELKIIFKSHHIDLLNVHLVSASLGVFLAGYITQLFGEEKISRLTGLDPAYAATFNPCTRYTITDKYPVSSVSAHFVDIHHTNMFHLGDGGLRGHVDIIYNNGRDQEVCDDADLAADNLGYRCSHRTAVYYYSEAIYSKIGFWGKPCHYIFDPYDETNPGICVADGNEEEVLVGESMFHKTRGLYLVNTNSFYPYSKGKTLQ